MSIQNSQVQTWLVEKVIHILQEQLHTRIEVEKVDFRPFNKIVLHNVFVADLNDDTLISAGTISASLLKFSNKSKAIKLYRVSVEDAFINLVTDTSGVMNLTELLDSFSKKDSTASVKDSTSFSISIINAAIARTQFRMHNAIPEPVEFGLNFQDLHLKDLNAEINNIEIFGDTIELSVANLSCTEKCGFNIKEFRTDLSFSSKHMDFYKLRALGMGSNIQLAYHRMNFSSMADLGDFINKVKMNGSISKSLVTTNFLSYVVPSLKDVSEKFIISGDYKGKVNDIRIKDLEVGYSTQTRLLANANLTGLPSISDAFIFLNIKNFTTTVPNIESIKKPGTNEALVVLPDEFKTLERITYSGNFTGFLSDFVAYGKLSTAAGKLSLDVSVKPNQNSTTSFKGILTATGLNLGKLIGTEMLGKTSLKATIEGKTDSKNQIEAFTDATIFSINANDYDYSNIKITGNLTSKTYVGSIFLDDPNAKLNFLGKIDFSDSIPVFDFSAFVPKIDLVKLNLNKVDSISQASFLLTAKFRGSNLDNSTGEIKIVNSFYKNQNGEIKTSDIVINANNNTDSKLIAIKSELVDGELRGKYNYANIFSSLQQLMYIYLPALSENNQKPEIKPTGVENPEYNDYIIKLRLKKTQKFTDVISPDFRIAENTNIFGIYNPDFQTFTLKVKVPELFFSGNQIKDITIDGETRDTSFFASITTPQIDVGGTLIKNVNLSLHAFDSKLLTNISWDNKHTLKNQGTLNALATFFHTDSTQKNIASVNLFPSQLYLNDTIWNVDRSEINVDTAQISINSFLLYNKLQKLNIKGVISSNPTDSIIVDLENLDISNFNFYTQNMGYLFAGRLQGSAKVNNILGQPKFFANIAISNLSVNNQEFGELHFTSQWFDAEKKLALDAYNMLNNSKTLSLSGDIFTETSILDFKASIYNLPIKHFAPLLEGNVSDLNGSINGILTITGTTEKPSVNGFLNLEKGILTVDFLKARYSITDQIKFNNSDILFNDFKIYDVNNRLATLNGTVRTNYFKDITLNLSLTPTNFQFLNTSERDNELFYGTVYASGLVQITGSPSDVLLNVSAKTEPHTALFLPLSSSSSVSEHSFLTFSNSNPDIIIIEEDIFIEEKPSTNLRLNLDLEVTPDAEAQIIIDKKLGDIIKANGSGNLKMEIDLAQDIFKMFGDYIIEKGDYLFTLQGVINKKFKIGDGSSISWNGDVTDALVDIKAIYSLRTTLAPLFGNQTEVDEKYKKRTPVDCQILLSGKLMEPNIQFNVNVPGAENDSEIQAILQDASNTDEKMSLQFLSLLVLNSFASPLGGTGGNANTTQSSGFEQGLANTASELLSNQLSNWLSQWSNAFDIGLNWRPGDPNNEISSSEVELALSTQLFNDRVSINGNVDMGTSSSTGPIAGDFNIDVKIVPSGKIRLKAFARSNDDVFYGSQSPYTTGAGVVYREDFNTLNELWNRFQIIFKPKAKKTSEEIESSSWGIRKNNANS